MRAVHPRACGEHTLCDRAVPADDGSSPRLRGTRGISLTGRSNDRFIPAPAGNTLARLGNGAEKTVHPRACGEHWVGYGLPDQAGGSSPRLRGTRSVRLRADNFGRFIPAPAGNTPAKAVRTVCPPVHPRACGEHAVRSDLDNAVPGSSPRLRGTLWPAWEMGPRKRFIPAPAGNTAVAAV